MPKPVDEDRARRKKLLEEKRAARKQRAAKKVAAEAVTQQEPTTTSKPFNNDNSPSYLCQLPDVAIHVVFSMLSAADLGRLILTCRHLNSSLASSARNSYLLSRLVNNSTTTAAAGGGNISLCTTEQMARDLWQDALRAGRRRRIIEDGPAPSHKKKQQQQKDIQECNQFVGYARFLEEAVTGYSILQSRRRPHCGDDNTDNIADAVLPKFTQGRWASCSPEHSLCRMGGDGHTCGPGGSGVTAWGVGKRGQLGHGTRNDERSPQQRLLQFGYSIRIVQVAAGGGLVRVAHSLLLTSTGRVLSFGTGQYGALGHGYNAAKQLPDYLRPAYIEALAGMQCICVAAGELHSAAVTSDGDVYTWGDGFCGQLGLGDKRPQVTPKQVTCGGLDEECVASISCGSRHTLAVTDDGECFSWGLGHFGVLGRSFTPFEYDADAAVVAFATADGGGDAENEAQLRARQMAMSNGGDAPAPPLAVQPGERDAAAELQAHLDLIANLTLDDSSNQCIPRIIDSLDGIKIVGSSAGHRHSLLLDSNGNLYSFGSGASGCLGHGDTATQMFPCRIQAFDEDGTRIMQFSAGVDMSMAVSTTGKVFAWGKTDGGRIGLGMSKSHVTLPQRVYLSDPNSKTESAGGGKNDDYSSPSLKAVDVECGYVHSIIVGLNGTIHICGGVGVDGEDDGQQQQDDNTQQPQQQNFAFACSEGRPRQVADFNIWHRLPEPKEVQVKKKYVKYGKYEVKGRTKMLRGED